MTERVESWIAMVDYDLDTAKAMYATKRWLYVGFMCHQSIEKMLKGYLPNEKMILHTNTICYTWQNYPE